MRQLEMSVGAHCRADYISHFSWIAGQALVADSYGHGRVVMAGDAVHLFTPQGGFGMNTGVDDAANLTWKLAALIEGWGGPHLLKSYEAERRPVAVRNTSAAQATARQVGDIPIAPEMLYPGEKGEKARRATGQALSQLTEKFASIGIQLGARYDSSPIVVGDGHSPPDRFYEYVPSASPGGRAPHFWLPGQQSLFDRFGRGFTLLCFQGHEQRASAFQLTATRMRIPLLVLSIGSSEVRDLYERDFALIRPDQHVAWRGNTIPNDVSKVLAKVTGWSD